MNNNLSKKNYAKYDRTFMAFGSIMNAFQGKCSKELVDWAWDWSKEKVAELVDDLYSSEVDEEKAL